MPYTVLVSFDKFFQNINLSGDHRDTANSRKDRIVSLLKNNNFDIVEAFPSGSIPRFTAVKGYADLDVIVALHYGKHIKGKKPSNVLQAVRDALGEYRNNVRKNGQAVTLYYNSWPNVDIVPVSKSVNDNGDVSHYNIPDMNTEKWIKSKPKLHSKNIRERAELCGASFRKIIKMIKWWNHQHSSILQSYHIEVMALKIFHYDLPASDIPWHMYLFFKEATALVSSKLSHEGTYVDDYLDWTKRTEAKKRLETAREKARDAWWHGKQNDEQNAIILWRQIFGNKFPAYG